MIRNELSPRQQLADDRAARSPHTRASLIAEQKKLAQTFEDTADTYRSDPHMRGYWLHAADGARMIARLLIEGDPLVASSDDVADQINARHMAAKAAAPIADGEMPF